MRVWGSPARRPRYGNRAAPRFAGTVQAMAYAGPLPSTGLEAIFGEQAFTGHEGTGFCQGNDNGDPARRSCRRREEE